MAKNPRPELQQSPSPGYRIEFKDANNKTYVYTKKGEWSEDLDQAKVYDCLESGRCAMGSIGRSRIFHQRESRFYGYKRALCLVGIDPTTGATAKAPARHPWRSTSELEKRDWEGERLLKLREERLRAWRS